MKIFLDTIGCRLNQAEIESMARQFRAAGHEIVPSAAEADLAVINTCAVTSAAASDSRAAVRRAQRLGALEVVVTGCWATLEPDKAASLPGVQRIIPNLQKDTLPQDLLLLSVEDFDLEPLARQPLPGQHQRTRAFIKVQDGCDNACTFCITTLARGDSRSRPVEAVLADIHAALDGGTQEIVLTGVHLGSWGLDLGTGQRLKDLVAAILEQTNTPRLRLSSLEPWDLEADFFELWSDGRLCRHLHLPLQSGSPTVLKRMLRKTTPDSFRGLVEAARRVMPDLSITTDVIAGFPGETEEEFQQTLEFIRSIGFAGGHVFTYSARPGTPAARMKGQVPFGVRKQRNALLREAFAAMEQEYHSAFVGQERQVLWESAEPEGSGFRLEGLTDNYIRVIAASPEKRWNKVDTARLLAVEGESMPGMIL